MSDVADALGWYSVPVPRLAVEATAEIVTRLPLLPTSVAWIHSVRKPVLMKTDRARSELRWRPKHTAKATLARWPGARPRPPPAREERSPIGDRASTGPGAQSARR